MANKKISQLAGTLPKEIVSGSYLFVSSAGNAGVGYETKKITAPLFNKLQSSILLTIFRFMIYATSEYYYFNLFFKVIAPTITVTTSISKFPSKGTKILDKITLSY